MVWYGRRHGHNYFCQTLSLTSTLVRHRRVALPERRGVMCQVLVAATISDYFYIPILFLQPFVRVLG